MKGARTDRVLTAFRIGDPHGRYPIYDSEGARLYPGRWNTPASPVIYTSEHYSTAMLEKLVHANGILPPNQHFIRITFPNDMPYEVFQPEAHPGWDGKDERLCKAVGLEWFEAARSALLFVPSIPARLERNILINPRHPDAAAITYEMPEPVWWDERLYG
ncbi:RES domain-containing protein [Sphingomonas sp. PL-96]|uniref:RES family NAD+ phosphorylase n=1 Tax=Sphingomonas sp. PL-96 TaxID=2887201 RepID=UPI001E387C2C|nr:RES domain-containing protein [Sphingomonas sp. PL-96]MCC2978142.1 RES domain-containing protein [Sphingomonas sp. PL-96]